MTKYSLYPVVDPRSQLKVGLEDLPAYNVSQTFNPGTRQAPWSGFVSNINTESILRNQVYALQKCSQASFVPDSSSDLYKYKFKNSKDFYMVVGMGHTSSVALGYSLSKKNKTI